MLPYILIVIFEVFQFLAFFQFYCAKPLQLGFLLSYITIKLITDLIFSNLVLTIIYARQALRSTILLHT